MYSNLEEKGTNTITIIDLSFYLPNTYCIYKWHPFKILLLMDNWAIQPNLTISILTKYDVCLQKVVLADTMHYR